MYITGSYMNYMNIANLLSPLGVQGSSNVVMSVFSSSIANLQDKIDKEIFSEESTKALSQLYNEVADLSAKASKLTLTDMDSVFNDRTPVSSNSNVLTATAFDALSNDSGASEAVYNISVTQLAQAQENTSLELNKDDASVINQGTNTFNINIDGQDNELSIEVDGDDTNADVLQKMKTAINEANLGVTADIEDIVGDTQKLVIQADNTGAENTFTISDVSGNAIAATAVNTISTVAQDAAYSVDETDYTSSANIIYLDSGMVEVNIKGVGEAILTVGPDESAVEVAISNFVSEMNAFIDFNEDNNDYIKDEVLSTINSAIADHKTALQAIGITQDENGKLVIASDELSSAVSENLSEVKQLFGGLDGLAVTVDNYASRIAIDSPLNYMKEAESAGLEFTDYIYDSTSEMMQNLLTGSLLNLYI